jgi:hypothetical protein
MDRCHSILYAVCMILINLHCLLCDTTYYSTQTNWVDFVKFDMKNMSLETTKLINKVPLLNCEV